MHRTQSKVPMNGDTTKVIVRFTSPPCEAGTQAARQEQIGLLRAIAETPDLQHCGHLPFQKLSMRHNGENWVVELEAIG